MAEFFLKHGDAIHSRSSRYRDGDIVIVRPDGWEWSVAELPNVVKRPDLNFRTVEHLDQEDVEWFVRVDETDSLRTVPEQVRLRHVDDRTIRKTISKSSEHEQISRASRIEDVRFVEFLDDEGDPLDTLLREVLHARRRFSYDRRDNTITDKVTGLNI